jgi:IS5 family transposase
METQTNAVFSILAMVHELCKEAKIDERVRPGPQSVYQPSTVITILIFKNLFGFNSERSFLRYLGQHHRDAFPSLPEQSWFNRKARALVEEEKAIHQLLLKKLRVEKIEVRIVDTTPIPVVKLYRANRCRLFKPKVEANFGYCASKKLYYYGQKLTLIITPSGIPTTHVLTPANLHDLRALKEHLPEVASSVRKKKLIGDKGYYDGDLELTLAHTYHSELIVPEKKRHQKKNTSEDKQLLRTRGIIETVNEQLQEQMNIDETKARSYQGLLSRIQASILSFTFGIYFNMQHGRPLLALKSILT